VHYAMELVTFAIFEDAEPGFLAANAAVNDWLRRQPGFLSRQLVRKDDGGWIDLVIWTNEAAAKSAASRMLPKMGQDDAMRPVDCPSVCGAHAAIGLSFSA